MMTALFSLLFKFQQQLLGRKIELAIDDREPADVLPRKVGRGVLQIDPFVRREAGIESHPDQTVLLRGRDLHFTNIHHRVRLRVERLQLSLQLDEEDRPIRRHRHLHRLL